MSKEYSGAGFQPVLTTRGSEMIAQFDEHRLTNNFKFGIIYQTFKQVMVTSLPDDNILAMSKLKEFADDIFNGTQISNFPFTG